MIVYIKEDRPNLTEKCIMDLDLETITNKFSKSTIHDLTSNLDELCIAYDVSKSFIKHFDPKTQDVYHHLKACSHRYNDYKEHIDLYGYLLQAIDSFEVKMSLCDSRHPHTVLSALTQTVYIDRLILYILGVDTVSKIE